MSTRPIIRAPYTVCIIDEQSNKNSNKSTSFVSAFVSSPPICNEKASDCGYNYCRCTDGHWPSISTQPTRYVRPRHHTDPAIKSIVDSWRFWQRPSTFGPNVLLHSLIPVRPFFFCITLALFAFVLFVYVRKKKGHASRKCLRKRLVFYLNGHLSRLHGMSSSRN